MKKQLVTFALAILVGALGFAVSGVALADNGKPPAPPGQDQCEHGNALKPCKDDPQPEKGKDCQEHGNQGGVNEDHCKGEDTTPTETTPTETTPSETTPTETTPTETTPTDGGNNPYTPPATVPDEPNSAQAAPPSGSSEPTPGIQGKPPVATTANGQPAVLHTTAPAVLGKTADTPKPTQQPQQAPFTL
jgi:hypothetical protein